MIPGSSPIVCEGKLTAPGLSWSLCRGYPTQDGNRKTIRLAHKIQALSRALVLLGEPYAQMAQQRRLRFVAGSAPALSDSVHVNSGAETQLPTLSLSHTGPLLLAAAVEAGQRLGVDVEHIRERDFVRLGEHLGWRPAQSVLPLEGGKQGFAEKLLFYRRWTLAESLYKALGIVNLECFTVLEKLAAENLAGWDSGWRTALLNSQRWEVRWWRVGALEQGAMVCLLRGRDD